MSLAHDGQGTSPPRVLILSGFWPPHEGGVERYAQAMADELAARGWQVHAAFSAVIGTQVGDPHHDAPDTGETEPAHEPDTDRREPPFVSVAEPPREWWTLWSAPGSDE